MGRDPKGGFRPFVFLVLHWHNHCNMQERSQYHNQTTHPTSILKRDMAYQHWIEVIVSSVKWNGITWVTSIGDSETKRERFTNPEFAKACALLDRACGMSVIIRPSFNESHLCPEGNKISYREWRSFNGELFQEIHFLLSSSVTMVRLDSELIIPSPPSD